MYGNRVLPGFNTGTAYKVPTGSIWRGFPEATCFKVVQVDGESDAASKLVIGTIMNEGADGKWTAIAETDIISQTSNLPSSRLGIVADTTAETGYTYTPEGASDPVTVDNGILIGVMGEVDRDKLLVGSKAYSDLTDTQKANLETQLSAWNIQPVFVFQA